MNGIDMDPAQLRGFADDVAYMLTTEYRGRIEEVRTLMGDAQVTLGPPGIGTATDYSGPVVGFAMGRNISEGLAWLKQLETGLEALSLASAVFEEKLATGDVVNAENLWAATETPTPVEVSPRAGFGDDNRYVI